MGHHTRGRYTPTKTIWSWLQVDFVRNTSTPATQLAEVENGQPRRTGTRLCAELSNLGHIDITQRLSEGRLGDGNSL